MRTSSLLKFVVTAFALLASCGVQAGEGITLAVTGGYSWDSAVAAYGKRLGFFAEKDINVEVAATDIQSQNLQAVISGSADIGSIAVPTFIAAAEQGAPVKMIASIFKGTPDFLWYVRSDSPIRSFKDITERTTIGVSSLGSTSDILSRALFDQYGVRGTMVAVGNSAAGMTQVMTRQIDIGTDGNGLLGVPQYASAEVRPIAYGSEVELMRNVSVRGFVVRADTLAKRRDVLVRFLQVYQKTIDWMYRDPRAIEWFAEGTQSTVTEAMRVRNSSYPQGVMQVDDVTGIDVNVRLGLKFKRIEREPTADELARMFETVWKPARE